MSAVRRSKILVYLALFCAAAAIGSLIYVLMSNEENVRCHESVSNLVSASLPTALEALAGRFTFRALQTSRSRISQFESLSKDLAANTEASVYSIFDQINAIATAATSQALSNNLSWPFVTVPNFEARANDAGKLTGIGLAIFSPIVSASILADWEAYAVGALSLELAVSHRLPFLKSCGLR
jgi:hypothetical protein